MTYDAATEKIELDEFDLSDPKIADVREYDPPTRDEVDAIKTAYSKLMSATRSMLEHALDLGDLLIAAKAKVRHGEWGRWLKLNTSISHRSANEFMRLAAHRGMISGSTVIEALRSIRTRRISAPEGKVIEGEVTAVKTLPAPVPMDDVEDTDETIGTEAWIAKYVTEPSVDIDALAAKIIEAIGGDDAICLADVIYNTAL